MRDFDILDFRFIMFLLLPSAAYFSRKNSAVALILFLLFSILRIFTAKDSTRRNLVFVCELIFMASAFVFLMINKSIAVGVIMLASMIISLWAGKQQR